MVSTRVNTFWAGRPEKTPTGMRSVLLSGAAPDGDPDSVNVGLEATVLAAARRLCSHSFDWRRPCEHCGVALLSVAERCRGSWRWPTWGMNFLEEVQCASEALSQVSRVRDTAAILLEGYDGTDANREPRDHLRALLGPDFFLTLAEAHRVIDYVQDQARPNRESSVRPRISESTPPRVAYTRAELGIAERKGWSQIQRFTVEDEVRRAAVDALTEADFIRNCARRGVTLTPFFSPEGREVVGYSAATTSLPADDRRSYGGKKLARDLSLRALRAAWWPTDDPESGAWATWLSLCPDEMAIRPPAERRRDGRWRWAATPDAPSDTDPLEHPEIDRKSIRPYLLWAQAGHCAVCSIRRFQWRNARTDELPGSLIGPAEHLDHDHQTGLVRGLLCISCNSYREVLGEASQEVVWRTYVQEAPAKKWSIRY